MITDHLRAKAAYSRAPALLLRNSAEYDFGLPRESCLIDKIQIGCVQR
jgi:hypothetical protein